MQISDEEFEKLLQTSKIAVSSEEEKGKIKNHIGLIVDWTADIKGINTNGVEPLVNVIWDTRDGNTILGKPVLLVEDALGIVENLKIKRHSGACYFSAPMKIVEF